MNILLCTSNSLEQIVKLQLFPEDCKTIDEHSDELSCEQRENISCGEISQIAEGSYFATLLKCSSKDKWVSRSPNRGTSRN